MKANLEMYTQYNRWANGRLAQTLLQLNSDLLEQEITSSFPSLRKTVYHIWDAELMWLMRLNNEVPNGWPSASFAPDTPIDGFLKVSERFVDWVQSHSEQDLAGTRNFANYSGVESTLAVNDMIMHCMNHSTFHRGQLVTMLRQLGVTELPQTDLIRYLRDLGN